MSTDREERAEADKPPEETVRSTSRPVRVRVAAEFVDDVYAGRRTDAEASELLRENPSLRTEVLDLLERRIRSLEKKCKRTHKEKGFDRISDSVDDYLRDISNIFSCEGSSNDDYADAVGMIKELDGVLERGEVHVLSAGLSFAEVQKATDEAKKDARRQRRKEMSKVMLSAAEAVVSVLSVMSGNASPATQPNVPTTTNQPKQIQVANVDPSCHHPLGSKAATLPPGTYTVGVGGSAAPGDYLLVSAYMMVMLDKEEGSHGYLYSDYITVNHAISQLTCTIRTPGEEEKTYNVERKPVTVHFSEDDEVTIGAGCYARQLDD